MKKQRHKLILQFIKNNNVSTQDEILNMLYENGFKVTQATISRDIKELKLIKEHYGRNKTRYAVSESYDTNENFKLIFSKSAYSLETAMNIIVIKCYSGTANAACMALDNMKIKGVVGSIAGDDTIFTVCKNFDISNDVIKEINAMLKVWLYAFYIKNWKYSNY